MARTIERITHRDMILTELVDSFPTPSSDALLSFILDIPAPSVRRTRLQLQREGFVRIQEYNDGPGLPTTYVATEAALGTPAPDTNYF
jgi:hypothetical protein